MAAVSLFALNLIQAIRKERIAEVLHCLSSGSSVNARVRGRGDVPDGWSALHEASNKNPLITKILLQRGANCNVIASELGTPLHVTSSAAVAKLLIEAGAVLDLKNELGETPIEAQIRQGHDEIVALLSQCGLLEAEGQK